MSRILLSESFDPFFNLSFENTFFSQSEVIENKPFLYLWRNSDVVVIGRFQNPWKECNLEKINAEEIALMRRDTGGGAVYHDIQNLCFTFVGSTKDLDYRKKNTELICSALRSLGFDAFPSGRNDIEIDGKKISGAAFREKDGKYIHHGTLLVGTDLTKLDSFLNPDIKKLQSKGINSVKARVTNLKNINPKITISAVINTIINTFCSTYSITYNKTKNIHETLMKECPELKLEYDRLTSWTWIFGKSPEFTHTLEGRFAWGGIDINFIVKKALIDDIIIYSDSLNIEFIESLKSCLKTLQQKEYNINTIKTLLLSNDYNDIATLCN